MEERTPSKGRDKAAKWLIVY